MDVNPRGFEPHSWYFGDVLMRNLACGYWFYIPFGSNWKQSITRMAERLRRWTQVPMDVNPRGFEPHSWYVVGVWWTHLASGCCFYRCMSLLVRTPPLVFWWCFNEKLGLWLLVWHPCRVEWKAFRDQDGRAVKALDSSSNRCKSLWVRTPLLVFTLDRFSLRLMVWRVI